MQKYFEKIIERLKKLKEYEANGDCPKDGMCTKKSYECTSCYSSMAIEIVKEVAEEFGSDINVGSNIVCKLKEFLKEKKKYNSEQADIWRDGADKDAYFREMKDLYMDRANTFGRVLTEIKALEEEFGDGWIPCSKDMPKENEEVLITTKTTGKVYKGTYTKRYGFSMREGLMCDGGFILASEVIAWQPSPEPYKEKENDDSCRC